MNFLFKRSGFNLPSRSHLIKFTFPRGEVGSNNSALYTGQANKQLPQSEQTAAISSMFIFASGGQGGRFLKKLPPLDPPAKTFD
jgi:hypothetical protein